jgi:hypothetical protein
MNTIVYNIILTALVLTAFIGVFSTPEDTLPTAQWVLSLLTTKAVGAAAIYAIYRLEKRSK